MNLVMIDILLPLFMIVPMFISIGADEVTVIKEQLLASAPPGIFIAGSFVVFMFISAMNGITATSVSREGSQLYMMKYLPIGYDDQLNAKLLSGMVVSTAGMILLMIVMTIFLEISIPIALLMLLSGLNAVILTRLTGMFIDAANPKLKWDNEQKAVKQNMNLVFNMLIGMGAAGLAVIFIIFAGKSMFLNVMVFIIGMAVVNYVVYRLLARSFPRMIERIE
jgi:ABC-2 type transport system permease protein